MLKREYVIPFLRSKTSSKC